MYKQVSFVITAVIMLTAFITIALYTGSQTAHAAIIVFKKHPILEKLQQAGGLKNATAGANMTKNTTAAGANMTK